MLSQEKPVGARIFVLKDGPYRVVGDVSIKDAEGTVLRTTGSHCLCRCGGSRNKPFCDATHGLKGFVGTEAADHSVIADRRSSYQAASGITVYDDRGRCAHFGQCTERLPAAFRAAAEPFVDPDGASASDIARVVAGCPSGALAYAVKGDPTPVEQEEACSISPIVDGPYRVRGPIEIVGADGQAYELRERQTLCRCGQSRNRPFCDGSHWYAGFRDPLPPELVKTVPSLYEWAGGLPALERLTEKFYDTILSEPDPVLEPIFRGMDRQHPQHVAAWLAETFGGPATYTQEHGGYEHMLSKHRNLGLTEVQRQRWVARMAETANQVGLPDDPDFRSTFVAYLEWGTRIALINSQPGAEVIEHAPIPLWGWGNTPPLALQPWDDPKAAERGRERYAQEQKRSMSPSL
jgi:CDGSH-type Zn-finger protein/truncated hemoglobin YjbI